MKRVRGATMKFAIGAAAMALVLAGFAFAAGIDGGGDDRGRTSSSTTTGTTTTGTTTEDRFDDRNRRGHKAKKGKIRRKNGRVLRNRLREPGEDVRGPCDEAEHRNDPRCTGAAMHDDRRGRDDDRRGRDDGHSGGDRSGSNSGPG
jgi:hypothetical protein